jgi:hypothetical protein
LAALLMLALLAAVGSTALAQAGTADQIPAADQIQPAELAAMLKSPGADKPLVLQVGSHVLYAQAHIPGSEYTGAAAQEAGRKALGERVARLDRGTLVVLYCGCCPWGKCPNIDPAYKLMKSLGFTRLKVLYIAENFGADWVDKGYPVDRGR